MLHLISTYENITYSMENGSIEGTKRYQWIQNPFLFALSLYMYGNKSWTLRSLKSTPIAEGPRRHPTSVDRDGGTRCATCANVEGGWSSRIPFDPGTRTLESDRALNAPLAARGRVARACPSSRGSSFQRMPQMNWGNACGRVCTRIPVFEHFIRTKYFYLFFIFLRIL